MTPAATLLGDRYQLDEPIGTGGYCEVWRATDTVLARPVAIKLLHPGYAHQAEALEWTSRDGKSLAITTGTGSGKTESFLLPMLAKLAMEAAHRPSSFAAPAVRAATMNPVSGGL